VEGVASIVFPATPGAYVLGVGGTTDELASLMQVPDDSAFVLGRKFAHFVLGRKVAHFGVIEERVHKGSCSRFPHPPS
jgi:hypothetical protein